MTDRVRREPRASNQTKRPARPIRRKLKVGRADDPLELEADQTADLVMQRLTGSEGTAPGGAAGDGHKVIRRENGTGTKKKPTKSLPPTPLPQAPQPKGGTKKMPSRRPPPKPGQKAPTTTLTIGAPAMPGSQVIPMKGQTKAPQPPAPTRQAPKKLLPQAPQRPPPPKPGTTPPAPEQADPTATTIGGAHKRTVATLDVVQGGLASQDTAYYQATETSTTDDDTAVKQQRAELQLGAAPLAMAGSIITLGESIRKLFKAKGGWDRTEAGMDVGLGVVKTGGAVTNLVDKVGQEKHGFGKGFGSDVGDAGKSQSTVASGSFSTIADIAGAIKDGITRVKKILDAVKKAEKSDLTTGEKWDEAIATVETVTATAKAAASAAKTIMTLAESSGATDAVKKAIPGLSLAVSAISALRRSVELVRTGKAFNTIRGHKRDIKGGHGWVTQKGSQSGQIAARRAQIETQLDGDLPTAERKELEGELEDIKQYETAKFLQGINQKRINRQAILLSTDLSNIIGEALTLSGVGAPAGIGVKAAATGVKASLPGARRVKQYGRDKAADAEQQGKTGTLAQKIFNPAKSSKAKEKQYEAQVNQLMSMLSDVTFTKQPDQTEVVKAYFRAAGISWTQLERYDDATELGTDLFDILKKRE